MRPIAVTDVLGLPRSGPQDTGSLTSVVQSFLNNVVMVTAGMQPVRGTQAGGGGMQPVRGLQAVRELQTVTGM